MNREKILLCRLRLLTQLFIVGLFLSGATAIPLDGEAGLLIKYLHAENNPAAWAQWLLRVNDALAETRSQHPFLFYGTDWLAFGHFMIALVFVGALRDPVRNRWLFDFGLMACALVVPYAMVFGEVRGIPVWWRMIDCSFGVLGFIPLWFCRQWALELEKASAKGV